jgi:hypothetical protein
MNGGRVCGHEHVEFSESVNDGSAVEARNDLTRIEVNIIDVAVPADLPVEQPLERRVARSGRDSIDHAPGAHDDLANCVAGLCAAAISRYGNYDGPGLALWAAVLGRYLPAPQSTCPPRRRPAPRGNCTFIEVFNLRLQLRAPPSQLALYLTAQVHERFHSHRLQVSRRHCFAPENHLAQSILD